MTKVLRLESHKAQEYEMKPNPTKKSGNKKSGPSAKLNKFRKAYGVFQEDLITKEIFGYVEHSFSMGWMRGYVRVWWEASRAEYYLNQMLINSSGNPNLRYFIVRLSGKSSIKADLSPGTDKFSSRNKKFSVGTITA
jgi:hypothetical protein